MLSEIIWQASSRGSRVPIIERVAHPIIGGVATQKSTRTNLLRLPAPTNSIFPQGHQSDSLRIILLD